MACPLGVLFSPLVVAQAISAHASTSQQLHSMAQRQMWTLVLLVTVAAASLAQSALSAWAVPAGAVLLLAAWLLVALWPGAGWRDAVPQGPQPETKQVRFGSELPVEIVSPFANSTHAPPAVSVQGSLEGEGSSLASSPDTHAR